MTPPKLRSSTGLCSVIWFNANKREFFEPIQNKGIQKKMRILQRAWTQDEKDEDFINYRENQQLPSTHVHSSGCKSKHDLSK